MLWNRYKIARKSKKLQTLNSKKKKKSGFDECKFTKWTGEKQTKKLQRHINIPRKYAYSGRGKEEVTTDSECAKHGQRNTQTAT